MLESKSSALPLGDTPKTSGVPNYMNSIVYSNPGIAVNQGLKKRLTMPRWGEESMQTKVLLPSNPTIAI